MKIAPLVLPVSVPRPPAWAVLGLLLLVSIGFNVWQAKSRWIAEAVEPLQDKIDGLTITAEANDKIAKLREEHDLELAEATATVITRTGERQVVYRDRMVEVPVPTCPPGQLRVDAWNAMGQIPGMKP